MQHEKFMISILAQVFVGNSENLFLRNKTGIKRLKTQPYQDEQKTSYDCCLRRITFLKN